MVTQLHIINKSSNNKCWRGCGEKGTLLHCWWEWKLVQPLWRTVWRYLRKLCIELPSNSTLWHIPGQKLSFLPLHKMMNPCIMIFLMKSYSWAN
uniref:Uncharacterized protein n=1 Tax=Sus scrofa TaxID=9823 RepID=A0A8D1D889_PIG